MREAKLEEFIEIQRDLGVALGACEDLDEALRAALDAVLRITDVDCGGIYLLEGDNLELKVHRGLSDGFVERARTYEPGSKSFELVMLGAPIYVDYPAMISIVDAKTGESIVARLGEPLRCLGVIPISYEHRPVGALNLASRRIDSFTPLSRTCIEAAALQIGSTVARLKATQALRLSQRNLTALFEEIDDFLTIIDRKGKLIHNNKVVEERLGYTSAELSAMHVLELHPPERREEAARILEEAFERTAKFCPIPLMTKSGEQIPVETKVTQGLWNGEQAVFGVSRDISTRLSSEAELQRFADTQAVLLREVNHRVTNNLTAIISMIHKEEDRCFDTETDFKRRLQEVTQRVKGLLTVHSMLTAVEWQPLPVTQLCEAIVRPALAGIPSSHHLTVTIKPSEHRVDADQAHHLALVLNELANNAVKYVWGARHEASVCIEFERVGDGLSLHFHDDGPGYPERVLAGESSATCIGFDLIRGLVRKSLRGHLELANDGGAHAHLWMPLSVKSESQP